jgi:uncharacterized protein (DUF2336 family)
VRVASVTERLLALRALARLLTGAGAMERLGAELHSPSATRRRSVLYALARMVQAGESARPLEGDLSRLVEDPDPDVRMALVHTATQLRGDPRPLVSYLAGDCEESVS